MLTTSKAWELKYGDRVVIKGEHYVLTEDAQPGPPGWTRLTTTDRDGLVTIHMIEGTAYVDTVVARDYSPRGRDATWRSRRAPGSSR